jgi:CHASE3 domain sensor protein
MKFISLIKRHALISAAILVLVFISANTAIVYYNNWILERTTEVKKETERAIYQTDQIWNQVVRNVDIGMRGYALTKEERLLQPTRDGERDMKGIVKELREITSRQGFQHPKAIDSIETAVNAFIKTTLQMVELAKADNLEQLRVELSKDPGKDAWNAYNVNATKIKNFENERKAEADKSYEMANSRTVWMQMFVLVIALPTLGFMIFRVNRDRKNRRDLFLKLEKNNREYLFNPGTEIGRINENQVIDNSIRNFKQATQFISQVSSGNFSVQWEGVTKENSAVNDKNLAGELIRMRDNMKNIKAQDEIRNWTTEGLAKFSDVIRQNQNNIQSLSYDVLVYLTKYMNAQQGCLFVLQEDIEDGHMYLEMTACYAFNRKKHVSKRIEIGQGVIGQAYLEGSPVLLTDVPNGYTEITSGLGESTPTCILVVPMRYNEKIEAVIEIAGFDKFEKHQVEFMEKVGEITASTLGSVRNTEKMQHLVDQFKTQTEQLKAQEEELRQNMEEMEATQEALRRSDREEYQ